MLRRVDIDTAIQKHLHHGLLIMACRLPGHLPAQLFEMGNGSASELETEIDETLPLITTPLAII
jgi:hypothetical protein